MHIFYQDEITRGLDIKSEILSRGWIPYRIETENFHSSIRDINRLIFASSDSSPVFGFASLRVATQHKRFNLPEVGRGMVMDKRKLTWSSYATILPPSLLLNPFGVMFPWASLMREDVVKTLKVIFGDRGVFLRPNSPLKPFAGFPTSWDDYEYNIQAYKQLEHVSPGEVVVVSSVKQVDPVEWRFWVTAGKIATFSPYSWGEVPEGVSDPPNGMLEIVERAIDHLEGYEDSLVIDVAETEFGSKIIELNGLSTSGFYPKMSVGDLLDALPRMYGF